MNFLFLSSAVPTGRKALGPMILSQQNLRNIALALLTTGLAFSLVACTPQNSKADQTVPNKLTIFAAASLANAFTEIGQRFSQETPEVELLFNFAGSQQLAQQLAQGAPADLFASANEQQLQIAVAAGRILPETAQIFAHNALVLITPQGNPAEVHQVGDLVEPNLKLVLAAADVPIGQYALRFFEQASADPRFTPAYGEQVLANVVSYEQNVRAVLTKVLLGEADAGIVYSSDVDASVSGEIQVIAIPVELNVIAAYPIAIVHDSSQHLPAQRFIDFLLSPTGQEILTRHGFLR